MTELINKKTIIIIDESIVFGKGLTYIINNNFSDIHVYLLYNTKKSVEIIQSITPFLIIINTHFIKTDLDKLKTAIDTITIGNNYQALWIINSNNRTFVKSLINNKNYSMLSIMDEEDEYIKCLQSNYKNKQYVSHELIESITIQPLTFGKFTIEQIVKSLTNKEIDLIKLILNNYDNKKIAEVIGIQIKSVEKSRSRICKKIDLPGVNNSLTKWVLENKSLLKDILQTS